MSSSACARSGVQGSSFIVPIVCDTTRTKSVQDLVEATVAQLGRVDILVNNASTPGGVVTGPLAQADDELLLEDIKIRTIIKTKLMSAAVPKITIERYANRARITIHTARPGIVIGRKGAEIDKLKEELSKMTGKEIYVDIVEVKQPRPTRSSWLRIFRCSSNAGSASVAR